MGAPAGEIIKIEGVSKEVLLQLFHIRADIDGLVHVVNMAMSRQQGVPFELTDAIHRFSRESMLANWIAGLFPDLAEECRRNAESALAQAKKLVEEHPEWGTFLDSRRKVN